MVENCSESASASPGAVLDQQGMVKLAPNFAWRDVALLGTLSHELELLGVTGLRIQVQNDYDVAALSEYEFGSPPQPDPLIYLGLGVGVGRRHHRSRSGYFLEPRALPERSATPFCNSKDRYVLADARVAPKPSLACVPSAPRSSAMPVTSSPSTP